MLYYNHTTSTLETNSFHMSLSLKSELVFTKPQLTLSGNCNSHESQRLTVYREFGDSELQESNLHPFATKNSIIRNLMSKFLTSVCT